MDTRVENVEVLTAPRLSDAVSRHVAGIAARNFVSGKQIVRAISAVRSVTARKQMASARILGGNNRILETG